MFLQACERKVYAYSEPVDMRKSFNGLIYLPVVKIKEASDDVVSCAIAVGGDGRRGRGIAALGGD